MVGQIKLNIKLINYVLDISCNTIIKLTIIGQTSFKKCSREVTTIIQLYYNCFIDIFRVGGFNITPNNKYVKL